MTWMVYLSLILLLRNNFTRFQNITSGFPWSYFRKRKAILLPSLLATSFLLTYTFHKTPPEFNKNKIIVNAICFIFHTSLKLNKLWFSFHPIKLNIEVVLSIVIAIDSGFHFWLLTCTQMQDHRDVCDQNFTKSSL